MIWFYILTVSFLMWLSTVISEKAKKEYKRSKRKRPPFTIYKSQKRVPFHKKRFLFFYFRLYGIKVVNKIAKRVM